MINTRTATSQVTAGTTLGQKSLKVGAKIEEPKIQQMGKRVNGEAFLLNPGDYTIDRNEDGSYDVVWLDKNGKHRAEGLHISYAFSLVCQL